MEQTMLKLTNENYYSPESAFYLVVFENTHSSGTLLYMRLTAKATSVVRHDLERVSDKTCCKYRMASGTAMTMYKDNDTSVTRGSATMKAERLDSYETASRLSPDDFPCSGVSRTNMSRT